MDDEENESIAIAWGSFAHIQRSIDKANIEQLRFWRTCADLAADPQPERPIWRNMIQCDQCGDVIESMWRWHMVSCSCGAVSVDGGRDYLRRAWTAGSTFTEMSTYVPEDQSAWHMPES